MRKLVEALQKNNSIKERSILITNDFISEGVELYNN